MVLNTLHDVVNGSDFLYYFSVPETSPANVSLDTSSPYSMLVQWSPPAIPNGVITGYVIYVTYANRSVDVFSTNRHTTSYNVTKLVPYQQISINVAAKTHIGEGPTSTTQVVRTAQTGMQCYNGAKTPASTC